MNKLFNVNSLQIMHCGCWISTNLRIQIMIIKCVSTEAERFLFIGILMLKIKQKAQSKGKFYSNSAQILIKMWV